MSHNPTRRTVHNTIYGGEANEGIIIFEPARPGRLCDMAVNTSPASLISFFEIRIFIIGAVIFFSLTSNLWILNATLINKISDVMCFFYRRIV